MNSDEMKNRFCYLRDYEPWLKYAFEHNPIWDLYELDYIDYVTLVMNSSPKNMKSRDTANFPLMLETLVQIRNDPSFLSTTYQGRRLSGTTIQQYMDTGMNTMTLFVVEKDKDMNKLGSYYIVDGMHRLVALGLLPRIEFPIFVYRGLRG